MPFYPPPWAPKLPFDPPDTVSIPEFMLDEKWGRRPLHQSKNMFTCGLSGRTYTPEQVKQRTQLLARGLGKEMQWSPNQGTEWDKVVGLFSFNTIDTITVAWAAHLLNGVNTPANAAYSADELEHQMKDAGAKCIFTNALQLDLTLKVANKIGIPRNRIFLLELPQHVMDGKQVPKEFKTVDQLILRGEGTPRLEPLNWTQGQGARQVAFLCYSSGTSGLPKGVMISHRNVITNVMQLTIYDKKYRDKLRDELGDPNYQENVLGYLPFSHIYGLVLICHATLYQGDGVIVMPRFEMKTFLRCIQDYRIANLYLVPPTVILMAKNPDLMGQYDLSCVKTVFTGAAPLGEDTASALAKGYPDWIIRQGYGLTETCTVVSSSAPHDLWFGSSGSLLPGYEAKIVTIEGHEVTGYDQPGELLAKSPSVVLGYLNNKKATQETFVDGYMRTGDEVAIRKSPNGYEHLFIVDRIKELIKVKGMQVAPAELEAHLLTHPAVADCAVIGVHDDAAGEVPKAFVVKSAKSGSMEDSPRLLQREIQKHVEATKARHKWLKGGVEFVDVIPKSPSGKILRRHLRDKEREARKKKKSSTAPVSKL